MMKYLTFTLIAIVVVSFKSENLKNSYTDKDGRIDYELVSGRFEGSYTSYYPNGKKKASGIFKHNTRIGIWSVWDSNGALINQREYTDLFTFKRLIPKPSNDPTVKHLNKPLYELKRNEQGYFPYSSLNQRAVLRSKRIWRNVESKNNPVLFNKDRLFKVFQKNILAKTVRTYSNKDDEFTEEIKLSEEEIKNQNNDYSIIAFQIKEEAFFDLDKMTFETRIIGIAPVGIHKTKKDTSILYWLYSPELRPVLAAEILEFDKNTTPYIENLDDVFFFRYFSGKIIKESNVYDRFVKDYATGEKADKEAQRIELSIIRTEHDFWLSLSK